MKTGILILAILMVIKPIVPVLEYAMNYEYISTVLCVNKANPKSCCKGKCHLKKQLNDVFDGSAASGSSGAGKQGMAEEIISIFFFHWPSFDFRITRDVVQKSFNPFLQDLYKLVLYKDFFHPPSFTV